MSNQNATVNRVTLLESIEAARNRVQSVLDFHRIDRDSVLYSCIWEAGSNLRVASRLCRLEIESAELEAWGDGP